MASGRLAAARIFVGESVVPFFAAGNIVGTSYAKTELIGSGVITQKSSVTTFKTANLYTTAGYVNNFTTIGGTAGSGGYSGGRIAVNGGVVGLNATNASIAVGAGTASGGVNGTYSNIVNISGAAGAFGGTASAAAFGGNAGGVAGQPVTAGTVYSSAGLNVKLYEVPANKTATFNMRLHILQSRIKTLVTNEAAGENRLFFAIGKGTDPAPEDYVECGTVIKTDDIIEHTGIVMSAGEKLWLCVDLARTAEPQTFVDFNVRLHGFEGDQ